ncbi:MAG: HPP family protein [Candidatus Binataceae bacterium]
MNGPEKIAPKGSPWWRSQTGGEIGALVYIALVAQVASTTGAPYLMFPELGALSHDVLTRPRGSWARAPVALIVTPVLTAIAGIIVTRMFAYGFLSVMLTAGGALIIIAATSSPIAPAISAGLLPLVLGVKTWWYPPGILFGTALLAALSFGWNRLHRRFEPVRRDDDETAGEDARDDALESPPSAGLRWQWALLLFVALAMGMVDLTGLRFILFPPLVVIAFEMLGHPEICPWARRPLSLPIACFLTAAGGLICLRAFGNNAATAATAMLWGIVVLRIFDLHIPPALAIALLPMVMNHPTVLYPISVGIGTGLLTVWFLNYAWLFDAAVRGASRLRIFAVRKLGAG